MSDFVAFEILPGNHDNGMVLLGDHAKPDLPAIYGSLGLPQSAFARHIAYDIGVEALVRSLSKRLEAPAVLCGFSRLLIDPNRGEDDPTLIMKISDGAVIPANHPMGPKERGRRLNDFYRPYHTAVSATISSAAEQTGRAPLVLSMHSFTPVWKNDARPWHAAILWDNDARVANALLAMLRSDPQLVVGDNEPYDGALKGDTMYRHCMSVGIPHALIEIRQDLIADERGVAEWTDRLAPVFEALDADADLHVYRRHASRTGPYEDEKR